MDTGGGEFSIPIRVYIEDTDAGGIVYYVNYLKFMERVRTELLRHLGFQHHTLANEGYQFVVHSANVKYSRPSRVDDALLSTAKVIKLGKTFILFNQQIKKSGDDKVLCQAEIKVACVDTVNLKPRAMSEHIRVAFLAFSCGAEVR